MVGLRALKSEIKVFNFITRCWVGGDGGGYSKLRRKRPVKAAAEFPLKLIKWQAFQNKRKARTPLRPRRSLSSIQSSADDANCDNK